MTTAMIMILLLMIMTPSPPQWPMDSGKIYDLRRLHSSKKASRCFAFCICIFYLQFVFVFAMFQEDQKVFCILLFFLWPASSCSLCDCFGQLDLLPPSSRPATPTSRRLKRRQSRSLPPQARRRRDGRSKYKNMRASIRLLYNVHNVNKEMRSDL